LKQVKQLWRSDEELFRLAKKELFTAVVGDVLDKMGLFHQFLPPAIKALKPDMRSIGRALPVLEMDVFAEAAQGQNDLSSKPFGLLFEALDDLKPNEIYVCTGASPRYALWGGRMSTRALRLEAAAAVRGGDVRDTHEIFHLRFPVFAYGSFAQDQGPRGKVMDFRVPVEIGGVRIDPGDIVFADVDGVLIIPRVVEREALTRALEKARGEKKVREAIEGGMSAAQAFAEFGIM